MIRRSRSFWILAAVVGAVALLFAANAGNILVVNDPQQADAIVVLAGETDFRPQLGLQLLDQKAAAQLLIDVPAAARIYHYTQVELAESYFHTLPESSSIRICPIQGLSTKDEAHDVANCLAPGEHRVLIVTSEYHTRRALSIFRHELPGRTFSVAGAQDLREFGIHWWRHREWAKTCFDEWLKLLWWNGVDRWR